MWQPIEARNGMKVDTKHQNGESNSNRHDPHTNADGRDFAICLFYPNLLTHYTSGFQVGSMVVQVTSRRFFGRGKGGIFKLVPKLPICQIVSKY